jgi:hypothetical protein
MPLGSSETFNDMPDLSQFGKFGIFVSALADKIIELENTVKVLKSNKIIKQKFYSLEETCRILGMKQSKVRDLVNTGRLKKSLDNRHITISVESVENYARQVLPL